jgi:hypothetical protein
VVVFIQVNQKFKKFIRYSQIAKNQGFTMGWNFQPRDTPDLADFAHPGAAAPIPRLSPWPSRSGFEACQHRDLPKRPVPMSIATDHDTVAH